MGLTCGVGCVEASSASAGVLEYFFNSLSEGIFFNSIDSPQGGATAASPFVCRNVGGPPCLVGLHVQDCIAEGTWGNDIFNFGYDLASIFARAT